MRIITSKQDKEYWEIYDAVTEIMHDHDLLGTDAFISKCVERVQQNADKDWNADDVRIAIRNTLNEVIEKIF